MGDTVTELVRLLDAFDALPDSVLLRARSCGPLHLTPGAPVGDVGTWIAEQVGRARTGQLFPAVPLFVAAARRP